MGTEDLEGARHLPCLVGRRHDVVVCTGAGAGAGWVTGAAVLGCTGTVTTADPSSNSPSWTGTTTWDRESEERCPREANFGPSAGSLPIAMRTDRTPIRSANATTLATMERFEREAKGQAGNGLGAAHGPSLRRRVNDG